MAGILFKLASSIIFFFLFFVAVEGKSPNFVKSSINSIGRELKEEKLSHLHLYWHDIQSGRNPTSIQVVAASKNTSTTGFGSIYVIDDPLTEGPEMSSKQIGRAQGFYTLASQSEIGLLMAMNFAFMEGKYNGSTITILGRNTVFSKVREMPVIGGSGLFRFARGYAQAKTYKFNSTGDATVEYNVFVMHY